MITETAPPKHPWHSFADARTRHKVVERMGTRMLTACGGSYSETEAGNKPHRKCKLCQKLRR